MALVQVPGSFTANQIVYAVVERPNIDVPKEPGRKNIREFCDIIRAIGPPVYLRETPEI